MKKVMLIVTVFCVCTPAFSQMFRMVGPRETNEIKFNLLMTLFSFPEISYEHVWDNNVGLGISAGLPFENNDTHFQVTPYGRFYFGYSPFSSFFMEGNVGILGRTSSYYDSYNN